MSTSAAVTRGMLRPGHGLLITADRRSRFGADTVEVLTKSRPDPDRVALLATERVSPRVVPLDDVHDFPRPSPPIGRQAGQRLMQPARNSTVVGRIR